MRKICIFLVFVFFQYAFGQGIGGYDVVIEDVSFSGLPGVQSFVVAESNEKVLIIGGRTDGLHQRQPFNAFLEQDNNKMLYVFDINSQQVWSQQLSNLPTGMYEQLQSTNMSFEQKGDKCYIIGGYGYSATAGDHISYPNLTAVDVPNAINAIIAGNNVSPYFTQITDTVFQLAGSYLDEMNGNYYLVGGNKFMGRYNPMGPNHGPGFVQVYSNQIRKFQIIDDSTGLHIANYSAITDTFNLHRRDYNMVPQIFPNGIHGFTAFSGVFQHAVDLPWLNVVDVLDTGYSVNNTFNQYLNQYHTANMALYDTISNSMYSVFFGGISRYYVDENDSLIDDTNVPFVNTISLVNRMSDSSMTETKIGEMPALLGSGAEFIINPDIPQYYNKIIKIDQLTADTVLVGYVYGGIESSQANIFTINTGVESNASSKLFAVKLVKSKTAIEPIAFEASEIKVFPNPNNSGIFNLSFVNEKNMLLNVDVFNQIGQKISTVLNHKAFESGNHSVKLDLSNLASGTYVLRLFDGKSFQSKTLVKQ